VLGAGLLASAVMLRSPADAQALPQGNFSSGGSMGGPRALHVAAALNNGQVLIYGASPFAELYDPATRRTEFVATPARDVVLTATATTLRDGKVLIAGGFRQDSTTDAGTPLATAMIFDPQARTWTTTGAMTVPRALHTATLLADGRVLVIGGVDSLKAEPTAAALRTSEVFDPATGRFTRSGSLTSDMTAHTATLLNSGQVLVASDRAYLYNPVDGAFALLGSLPVERVSGTATRLEDGTVLLVGGGGGDDDSDLALASAERFDPATGRFTPVGALAQARAFHTATRLPNGQVLVAGGFADVAALEVALATTEVFDPATNRFSPGPSMATARWGHAATTLPDGRVVVTGGLNGSDLTALIEVYTPATLAKPYAGSAPSAGSQSLLVTSRTATADELVKALGTDGCSARVIAHLQAGTWRIYLPGAPSAVNAGFPASLPARTPLSIGCT
jgi:hypothetical protein